MDVCEEKDCGGSSFFSGGGEFFHKFESVPLPSELFFNLNSF